MFKPVFLRRSAAEGLWRGRDRHVPSGFPPFKDRALIDTTQILPHLQRERCLFGFQEFLIQFLFGPGDLEVKFVNALCA